RVEALAGKHDDALALLVRRGLSAEVRAHARAMIKEFPTIEPAPEVIPDELRARFFIAEEALWSWYKMWSAIARSAISSKTLLRQLGFGQRRRKGAVEQSDVASASAVDVVAVSDA
ncbi:MAG: hypothetical protein JRH20_27100, partial [Deltaproteobacteria bacterium]|nr:hypothetical protein [Deltaproteobacteria bacterium]